MSDSRRNTIVRVKEEGFVAVWSRRGYVEGVFISAPKMLSKPVKRGYNCSEFVQKYGLAHSGMNSKQVRCPRDCKERDVLALFGLYVEENGHNYMYCGNKELITYIERLWIIIH